MKHIFLTLVFLWVCLPQESTAQWLYTQNAAFLSVSGQVSVKNVQGSIRKGAKDSEVYWGETVRVDQDSLAALRFFDGSNVEINPNSQLMITSMNHPTDQQKEIRLRLMAGWVLAKVEKLKTASSLFEIEAGGVVCGVRGTQFSVEYEPNQETVDLKVMEGTVYAKAQDKTYFLNGGDEIEFNHGQPDSLHSQDTKSALKDIKQEAPDLRLAEALPPGLEDLNAQFMGIISFRGNGFSANPALSLNGTAELGPALGSVSSFLPGNVLHLTLPKLP